MRGWLSCDVVVVCGDTKVRSEGGSTISPVTLIGPSSNSYPRLLSVPSAVVVDPTMYSFLFMISGGSPSMDNT